MILPRDPVGLIELAYRQSAGPGAWCRRMALPLTEPIDVDSTGVLCLPLGAPRMAGASQWVPRSNSPFVNADEAQAFGATLDTALMPAQRQSTYAALGGPGLVSLRSMLGRDKSIVEQRGVRDIHGVVVRDAEGPPLLFASLTARERARQAS